MSAGRLEDTHPALDAEIIRAHMAGDAAALAGLYTRASEAAEAASDPDGAGFFLTHAYVFALEAGLPEADELHARLKREGREE